MPSIYRFATHYALKNNLMVISKYLIKYSVTGSIGSSKAIFFLTESHFFLFEQNKNKLIFISPWKNISSISADDLKLTLGFPEENGEHKKFTIWSSQSDLKSVEIKIKVAVLLQRVLSRSELSALKIKDLNEAVYYPTARSPMARFRMWDALTDPNLKLDSTLYMELHKKIVFSLVFKVENLQLNNFPQIEKILPIYLDILKVAPQVTQLRVPMIPIKRIYENIVGLLADNDYLQFLEISGHCQKNFFYIIKAIKDNKNSKISSLSFVNTQFSIEELTLLYNFITAGSNVNVLEFHSSISSEAVDYFYSSFLTPILCEKIAILNLNQSPGINTQKLFPKITNISMLSLEGCDIELGDVFNCIADGTAIGLKVLNISRCYVKTIPDVSLPQFNKNFQTLIINEVSWPSGTLVPFFEFFFSHFRRLSNNEEIEDNDISSYKASGPCLYFSNEIAETDEWLNLFDYLETVDDYGDLSKLGWNENPVHKNLFNFLKQNDQLHMIKMSGCFSEECPDSINDLCDFISSSVSFTTLIISGTDINHFGKYSVNVINSLKNHQALKKLDISNSYGGDEVLLAILSLVENNLPLEMIDFDNVHIQNPSIIVNLMKSLYKLRNRIQVSFPTDEFSRLKSNQTIPKDQFDEMTHLFKIPFVNGPSNSPQPPAQNQFQASVEIPVAEQNDDDAKKTKNKEDEEDDLPYVAPSQILAKDYCIFKNYNPPDFPCIVSKEQFEELRKQTRQQKAISSSPRHENDPFSRSSFSRRNSPKGTNHKSNFDDDDEKIWPRSQKEILEARKNLKRSTQKDDQESTDSTKSPKSLDSYDKVHSPTATRSITNSNNAKGKRTKRPLKSREPNSDEYEEEEFNDKINNRTQKKRSIKSSGKGIYDDKDYSGYDSNNRNTYVSTPKDSNKYENFEIETSQTVSLSESTDEDDFVFEENKEPAKTKKALSSNKQNISKKANAKKTKNTKKKARTPRNRPPVPIKVIEEYEYSNDNQVESDSDQEVSSDDAKPIKSGKKRNTRKSVKNPPIKATRSKNKLYKSQPAKTKKKPSTLEKKNLDNDSNKNSTGEEQRKQVKNRNIPSNQFDDIDEEDVFNSQIFDEQMPKIDKYDNSSNWQKYDQEFALNALFTRIKYNKSE